MKNVSMPTTLIFLSAIILMLTQCSNVQSDANLVAETCKKTPHYDLCVYLLKTDPRSSTADVTGLGLIMVDKVKATATAAMKVIKQLRAKRPELKKPLSSCAQTYDTILTYEIAEAVEALQKGDPKFAEAGMDSAASSADSCEAEFHGKSPLSKLNSLVRDISHVASAIARILL